MKKCILMISFVMFFDQNLFGVLNEDKDNASFRSVAKAWLKEKRDKPKGRKNKCCDWVARQVIKKFNLTTAEYKLEEGSCRNIVINQGPGSVGKQEVCCWRLRGDMTLVVMVELEDGSKRVVLNTSWQSHSDRLFEDVAREARAKEADVVSAKAVLFGVNGDEYNGIRRKDLFWGNRLEELQGEGFSATFCPYELVPGDQHREIDHFRCKVDRKGVCGEVATRDGIKTFCIKANQGNRRK